MKQLRAGALALGAAAAVVLASGPLARAGEEGKRIEVVRRVGGGSYLGVSLEETQGAERGARVKSVMKGSPAEKAGLKGGDVIVEFGGQKIVNIYDYTYAMDAVKIGQPVQLVVLRDGQVESDRLARGAAA